MINSNYYDYRHCFIKSQSILLNEKILLFNKIVKLSEINDLLIIKLVINHNT